MNTKTTLLGVLGIVTVAGAGYFYMNSDQDMSKMPQQIGQYLPEAVLDYLPESFSPDVAAAPVAVVNSTDENNAASDQQVSQPAAEEEMLAATNSQAEQAEQTSATETADQKTAQVTVEAATEMDPDTMNADLMGEIEQSVAEVSNETATSETKKDADVINHPETSKEALALKKQIEEVNGKLAELDTEKETLEERFQKVLKQNRTLALKLKEIDEKLKVNMK
jgi:chromosome segregation ATPase